MVFPLLLRLAVQVGPMLMNFGQAMDNAGSGGGAGRSRAGITGTSFKWTSDTISPALYSAAKNAPVYLARATEFYALKTEAYAKAKAPWRDRTGNARSGLTTQPSAEVGATGGTYQIDIFHRVPYGIWLEVRHNGRHGIIKDAVNVQGEAFFRAAQGFMGSMFGGR